MPYDSYQSQVEQLKRRRDIARAIMQSQPGRTQQAGGMTVPMSGIESIAPVVQALLGTLTEKKADQQEKELQRQHSQDVAKALSTYDTAVPDEKVASTTLDRINNAPEGQLMDPVYGQSEARRKLALELMPADEAMTLEYKRQIAGDNSPQGVQSTIIGEDGYYYTVDRLTGKPKNTGVKAAPSMRVVEQEGNVPFGVVTGRGKAGSIIPFGSSPVPAGTPPYAPPSMNGQTSPDAPSLGPMVGPIRKLTAGERAREVATARAGVELATKPEITKQTELAKTEAERKAALPGALADIQKMRTNVQGLLDSPGFDTIYGASGTFDPRSYLPGTDAAGTKARLGQVDAQAFQTSIQNMRGLGALSNAEGAKVSAAFTRATSTAQTEEDARQAWQEVLDGLALAEERLRAGVTLREDAPAAPPGGPKQIKSDAEYDALPSGAEFIDPEGNRRRKP